MCHKQILRILIIVLRNMEQVQNDILEVQN